MSSYRSYTPWKSNLSSSYKPASSAYTLGGDLGSGSSSRYTSLATPSAYRPSFSGGTYRIKRDPPPPPVTSYVSRYGSTTKTDTKDGNSSSDRSSPIKRYTGATSSKLGVGSSKYGRSRDPSPVALEHTNRGKSKSRDPSPVLDSARSKLGGATYRSSTARNGYNSRYAAGSRLNGGSSSMLDKSISYLTTSDFHARTASRAKASREKELDEPAVEVAKEEPKEEEKQQLEEPSQEKETFVSVVVVTRATSPTPPGSTTVQRTRRMDIAKTIEKTIQRSTKPRQMLEKEMQSDRLDDSTRYLRYSAGSGASSSISSNYSHRDRISSLRYNASSQSNSNSPKSGTPSLEPKEITSPRSNGTPANCQSPSNSPRYTTPSLETKEVASPKSNGTASISTASSKSSNSSKSKLSPPKAVRLNSRQSSVENLVNKPPAAPSKADSPVKTCNSSSNNSNSSLAKWPWPNKDFRKSSLNVGPTDRPRKSRTPSSGAESEEQQQERSPSAGSEGSNASNRKVTKLTNGKATSSNRQLKAHKSCAPSSGGSGSGSSCSTTSACSSSDSEQRGKTNKKQSKKKSTVNGNQQKEKEKEREHKKDIAKEQEQEQEQVTTREMKVVIHQTGDCDSDGSQLNREHQNSRKSATDSRSHESVSQQQQLRLQKLSGVSNFFATRQPDANSEPIFLESSESAGSEGEMLPSKITTISLALDTQTNETSEVNPLLTTILTTLPTTIPTTLLPSSTLSSSTHCPKETTSPNETKDTTTTDSLSSEAITTRDQEGDTEEPSWWQDTSLQINTASALDYNNRSEMPFRLRHIDSGDDHAWWLRQDGAADEDDTLAEETLNPLDDEQDVSAATEEHSRTGWWSSSKEDKENESKENQSYLMNGNGYARESECSENVKLMPRSRISPEQDAWWLEEQEQQQQQQQQQKSIQNGYHEDVNNNEPTVEVTIKLPSCDRSKPSSQSENSAKHWWQSGPAKKLFNVQRVESGERAWWQEKENEPPPVKPPTPPPRIIKHWESGERAWWLQEEEPKCKEESPLPLPPTDEVDHQVQGMLPTELSSSFNFTYRPPPLGQCASPVPLEPLSSEQRKLCSSPYDNIPMSKVQMAAPTPPPRYSYTPPSGRVGDKLFISRHQNIDELLGGACRSLSPLFYSGAPESDASASSLPLASKNMFLLEEITPDQVRIHDSTAQLPVIQRMQRDVEWLENGSSSNFYEQQKQQPQQRRIDDAAIQVYKDGDFGAYLDLESSLAEQSEEIEGLQASRKNSLVVRTQLSVRVHAIIEKLLSSEGSDLRRALFSLKQVFQEDKDLVHAFVALGGLNCLVRVGNCADQNYQNYILRALGQVMLYVDGMNGVMKHQPTMEWLYSLIASNYRSVVKTALKLLLVFVEYAESNCYVLVSAIHSVDEAQGTLPWANIMRLLKDYDNADAELVIYATSLINKTLAGLTDQDSFYDESDLLEQQGMETVIQRYMSKPGTDLDLLDQLQLYEAVLKFEDGESDGQRLPQNSLRKTQRYRPGTNTTERRKSKRHSTEKSPSPLTKVLPTAVLRLTPTQPTLDEDDSSGSTNSTEFSSGIFQEKKPRDGAGVTPGLRRRRERAERHKSFLKEQEEAAANGIFAARELRESYGQIVTAIPATIQSGDSPPQSLQIELPPAPPPSQLLPTLTPTPMPLPTSTPTTTPCNISNNNNSNNNSCNNNQYTHSNNNIDTPNNSLLLSPTKQLLSGINSISIINNSFDKANNNNYNNTNNQNEFLTKKNLFRERNATVINGIMKNIIVQQTTDSAYKKYENDANRLNNYYTQLSQSPKHLPTTAQEVLSPKKTLNGNGFEFVPESSTPLKLDMPPAPEPLSPIHKPAAMALPPPPPPPPPPPLSWWHSPPNAARTLTSTNPEQPQAMDTTDLEDKEMLMQLKRDHTVKDLTQKLSNLPSSPTQDAAGNRAIVGDMSGLISKAKEGLAKSKSKGEISRSSSVDQELKKAEPKKSENELHWEELVRNMRRPLNLCDLDFTDLHSDDEKDVLAPRGLGAGIPPPPPPQGGSMILPPPMMPPCMAPPPMFSYGGYGAGSLSNSVNSSLNGSVNGDLANGNNTIKKNKKTVKLFWKEVREDMIPQVVGKTIWDELPNANVDTQKLEHLFESRAKDLMTKKQQELNKSKEVIVLDHKRSNAINIAMTKLPPPRAIKAAILKMDATVVTREGIDKLLNMLPTDEERGKIQEAQMSNPELPLGSAEQFLLTLATISELGARLKLWAFRLDFDNCEKEIAEPLMDLKQGIEILRQNRTFRCILSTLLSVGIFLNGAPVKGFQIEYLAKVPEVKDTVHKHSLLHHLCHMVMETSSDTTDLYSEIGPITRASKADFTDLAHNLNQLEAECKASWDRLKLIAKHECAPKLVDFLADCAERIISLQIVHRRVMNRYRKFLLWLGMPQHSVAESRPNEFCRTLSEFALEYRTTRERVQQQLEKKANHRERNKTRGKLIIDMAKFKTKEDSADAELKQLLGTPNADQADGTLTWRRRRAEQLRSPIIRQSEEQFTDGDDEILESLVKTATKAIGTRTTPRERKRTRHADRKSLRRTLKNGLTDEEKQHVAALIQTY